MNSPRPDRDSTRLGSWGTTRSIERRYGYPAPLRNTRTEILERLEELERWRDSLDGWEHYFTGPDAQLPEEATR